MPEPQLEKKYYPITRMGVIAPLVGLLVPGGGHLIQRRWGRGLVLLASVLSMFSFGILMEGKVYAANTGDVLDMLGFVGDLGNGLLYFAARVFDWGRGAVHIASADYGTKFIIVSGLLNVIAAVDAHHIAIGKKL